MKYLLNEFMRIRLEQELTCDLLLEGTSFRIPDPRLLTVLASVEVPASREDLAARIGDALTVEDSAAEHFLDQLVQAKILRPADSDHEHELLAQAKKWHHYGWTDALVFHCLSGRAAHSDVMGAEAPASPDDVLGQRLSVQDAPPFWKKLDVPYKPLPAPAAPSDRNLGEVLLSRRTHVSWSKQRLTAEHVSRVLHDANLPLVKLRRQAEAQHQEKPSTLLQNVYGDIETYLVVHDMDDIKPGVYHYDPDGHTLGIVAAGDFRDKVQAAFVGQKRAATGSCSLLLSVVWERHMFRYAGDPRAYRTMLTLMGQFAQRYLVAWTALGYTTFLTPAHYPELTDAILGTKRFEESGIYLITAG